MVSFPKYTPGRAPHPTAPPHTPRDTRRLRAGLWHVLLPPGYLRSRSEAQAAHSSAPKPESSPPRRMLALRFQLFLSNLTPNQGGHKQIIKKAASPERPRYTPGLETGLALPAPSGQGGSSAAADSRPLGGTPGGGGSASFGAERVGWLGAPHPGSWLRRPRLKFSSQRSGGPGRWASRERWREAKRHPNRATPFPGPTPYHS